jgi:predicted nucleotidyltransferase
MVRIPKDPKEIFEEITKDYQIAFGNDLLSIALYGSGATGDYVPKKSDLNFLIALTEEGINTLEKAFKVVSKWRKRNISIPLFLTKSYITSSLDSFPIEFLNMKMNHILVFGEDVLANLSFEKGDLRVQCERELKAKLLQLRQGYLDASKRVRNLSLLIASSIPAFIAIFRTLLYLKDIEVPAKRAETVSRVCEEFDLDHGLFSALLSVKDKGGKSSKGEMDWLIHRYISEVRRLSSIVDKMDM